MVMYINNIIWRFISHKPDEYRLLDVRHNVMKSLILSDSDHLIKFILFGNEECKKEKFTHIPRSITWKKNRSFVNDDDLCPFECNKCNDTKSKHNSEVEITNDLELAIYHCKGNLHAYYTHFMTRNYG